MTLRGCALGEPQEQPLAVVVPSRPAPSLPANLDVLDGRRVTEQTRALRRGPEVIQRTPAAVAPVLEDHVHHRPSRFAHRRHRVREHLHLLLTLRVAYVAPDDHVRRPAVR